VILGKQEIEDFDRQSLGGRFRMEKATEVAGEKMFRCIEPLKDIFDVQARGYGGVDC